MINMILRDLFPLALQNVKRRRKRAMLTMLGVFIDIAAVVALVSLGQGLQQTINAQFEKVGADKILVEAKEIGFGGEDAPGQMTEHELELLQKVSGVKQAAGNLFRTTNVEFNNVQR